MTKSRRTSLQSLSLTSSTEACVEALEEALALFGAPEIFNTDQSSQFEVTAGIAAWVVPTMGIASDQSWFRFDPLLSAEFSSVPDRR